jgi:uncharacterized UBP type Zn finger protein
MMLKLGVVISIDYQKENQKQKPKLRKKQKMKKKPKMLVLNVLSVARKTWS